MLIKVLMLNLLNLQLVIKVVGDLNPVPAPLKVAAEQPPNKNLLQQPNHHLQEVPPLNGITLTYLMAILIWETI